MPAVEANGLVKRYGAVPAVEGVSFSVDEGEVFALLGPNGAGKTTTVEILEGYRRADAGSVRVLGLDPARDAQRLRPRIGVMLQEGGVYPGIRSLEALRLFAAYYDDREDPERLLADAGLREAARTPYRRLSGGQKQRLALALALVGKPEVAFLDEPTSGMDPRARAATWELIRALKARRVTVFVTTHYLEEAERLADRVAIIDRGRLVALGTPAELTRAGPPRSEMRFGASGGIDVAALSAALGVGVREERPGEYAVGAPGTPELVARLTAWLADCGITIADLRVGRATLEDVFLKLTEGAS
jgi:ABC-2 type transport system ATP-binding protein